MNGLTRDHKNMLATWERHTYAEFVLKDPDAAVATMTDDPYVLIVPTGTGVVGRRAVRDFYADQFLPGIPPDFALTSVSQTFGSDRIVEEFVVRFTHTLEMGWMLPGVSPRGRRVEFALVGVVRFQAGKVAHEHIYWDQATVLSQLGLLAHPIAAAGARSAAQLLDLALSSLSAEALNA
jgi:carboxymethylenebutenolidase